MYKRYLEDDNVPLTKYMEKEIKKSRKNVGFGISSNGITSLEDNSKNDAEIVIENDEMIQDVVLEETHTAHSTNDNDDFFRQISDQLIHPNLECKTADAIAMILAYFLQHHLTWVALEDLLKLFHNILGDASNLPKTKYFFRKCFGSNQRTVFHFYCKKCMLYIDTYENLRRVQDDKDKKDDTSCETCSVCDTEYSLRKMNEGHFFIELPLREQIERKIAENLDILSYDTTSNSPDITDYFDCELYKSLRAKVGSGPLITLTLNTDGVRVFKSKRKASLWPIQLFINEVPPNKRLKQENIILSGIWFGTDPVFELYMKPLIKEMRNLDDDKITHNTVNVTVRVLFISADSPAKAKFLKLKQFNGKFGCSYCRHPGFLLGDSKTSKYIVTSEKYALRTHSSTVALMKMFLTTGEESFGVMGVSPLVGLPDYDLISLLIRGTVIDYLHCVLEGVTDLLLDKWFDSKYHRENYYITPRGKDVVNKNIKAIKPLKTFSISPRPIEDREHWKAHELKYWLLYYAVPCLTDTLKQIYTDHLTLLSEAMFIFLKTKITPSDYIKASTDLFKFVNQFQTLYGEESMNHCVHLLEHVPKCVKDCGPSWAYSNFNFESNNGSLVKHVNGTTDVEHQIASKYGFNNALACLKKVSGPTFNYIDRMRSMRVKKSEKTGAITLFGTPHKHKLDLKEKQILNENADHIMAYYKFFSGNDVYFSTTYGRAETTDDTTVLLKDERIGQIRLIFKQNGTVLLLLKILKIERVQAFPEHIKKIVKDIDDKFEVVSAEEVLKKLLRITTTKGNYISELPNQYEGD